jgi:hypothetical protein
MRLIIDAFDELMLHHDMCSFSFSELLTWIKGRFDCIWKAWKVNEVDWGPNPSIPNVLRSFWKAYQVYFPTDLDSWLYLIRCFHNRRFNAGTFSAFGAVTPYFGPMVHVSIWVH